MTARKMLGTVAYLIGAFFAIGTLATIAVCLEALEGTYLGGGGWNINVCTTRNMAPLTWPMQTAIELIVAIALLLIARRLRASNMKNQPTDHL